MKSEELYKVKPGDIIRLENIIYHSDAIKYELFIYKGTVGDDVLLERYVDKTEHLFNIEDVSLHYIKPNSFSKKKKPKYQLNQEVRIIRPSLFHDTKRLYKIISINTIYKKNKPLEFVYQLNGVNFKWGYQDCEIVPFVDYNKFWTKFNET